MWVYFTPANVAYFLIAVNTIAFCSFGIDKMLAEAGRRRISEATLLMWGLIGGTLGAYAGRHIFRHKTRKQPFSNRLHTQTAVQIAALIAFMLFYS